MNFFSKEKDLILKFTNLALILMFIGSLLGVYSALVDITLKEKPMNYEVFEKSNCTYYNMEADTDCQAIYENYEDNLRPNIYRKSKIMLTALGGAIIIGGALYFLNRKKVVK